MLPLDNTWCHVRLMQHGRQPAGIGIACTVHKLECLLTVSRQCHCSASKLSTGLLAGKPAGATQCATLCFGGWQRLPHCLAVWQQGARLSQNYSQKVAFAWTARAFSTAHPCNLAGAGVWDYCVLTCAPMLTTDCVGKQRVRIRRHVAHWL